MTKSVKKLSTKKKISNKKREMEDGPGIILYELGALCACVCTADLPFQLYLINILNVNLKT